MAKKDMEEKKRRGFTGRQWLILATVMIASFLGRLDGTIVNLALPKIIQAFGITVAQASWISTAYIIANAIFVPIFGKLGDMIGRKPLYLFGIIGFTITSMLAGLSFNLPSMIIFRILQAITVSIDYPIALSIIAFSFDDKNARAQAMGLWSAIFAAAAIFGPLLGGPLIDTFTWRSVFYINIPLGILGAYLAATVIQEPAREIRGFKNFDIFGSLLLGICLGSAVLVLDQGQSWGWDSIASTTTYFIIAISFLIFLFVEKRQKEPVVDLNFFTIPTFSAAITTSFISFIGLIGGIFLIPLFAQNLLGYTVTKSGYLFIPMALTLMASAPIGARLSARIQPRILISGGMFLTAIVVYYLFSEIDIKWTFWDFTWRLMIFAFGLGIGLSPLTSAATSTVPIHEVGIASSILALARNISGAFGVAIFATILTDSTTSNMALLKIHSIINTTSPELLREAFGLMTIKANVLAYANVFHTAGIFMAIGGVAGLFVKESKRDFAPGEKVERDHMAVEV